VYSISKEIPEGLRNALKNFLKEPETNNHKKILSIFSSYWGESKTENFIIQVIQNLTENFLNKNNIAFTEENVNKAIKSFLLTHDFYLINTITKEIIIRQGRYSPMGN
jgi:hypothetical protein